MIEISRSKFEPVYGATFGNVFHRSIDPSVGAIALWSGGEVYRSMGERNSSLWHANKFDGLLCRDSDAKCITVCHANIFAGSDDDAAGDETDVLSCVEHLG